MTKDNYTLMSNKEFASMLMDIVDVSHLVKHLKKNKVEIYQELIERTKKLGSDLEKMPISAILYCFRHDIMSLPTCKRDNCHNLAAKHGVPRS